MKLTKSLRLALPLMAAMAIILVTGCKETQRGLLDTVPDSAKIVTTLDFDKILKSAGCQIKDGKYELTPELTDVLGDSDVESLVGWLGTFSKLIDINHAVIYMLDDRNGVCTVSVTDEAGLVKALTDYGLEKRDTRKGYDVYEAPNKMVFLMKDGQGWFARRADDVIESVSEAEKKTIANRPGVKEYLFKDNPVNYACCYSGMSYRWLCGSVKLSDSVMSLTLQLMDDDGKSFDFGEILQPIDTDFLRYAPSNAQLAAAFSVPGGIPWDSVKAIVMAQRDIPSSQKGVLEILFEQLKKIDGTVAVCASPAAGSQALSQFNLSSWDMLLMVHMKPEEVNANVGQIAGMARQFRLKVEEEGGVYHTNLSSLDASLGDVYFGNVDGYFAVSTRPFDPNANDQLKRVFEGKNAAIALDVPYGCETMKAFELPYGFNVTMQVDDDAIEVRSRFNGTNGSFLSSLISMIAKMGR